MADYVTSATNLIARVAEVWRKGWLSEVECLRVGLAGAEGKLARIDRRTATTTDFGIPSEPTKS